MKHIAKPIFALMVSLALIGPATAADHYNQKVADLATDNRSCIFFSLKGEPAADPTISADRYFGVSRSHPGFAEIFAMLLTAKISDLPINVSTDGTSVCGKASAVQIVMPQV